jgi:hypothetical protein
MEVASSSETFVFYRITTRSYHPEEGTFIRGRIQKFPDWVDNEISNNNKYALGSDTKCYGGETHYTDPQSSDTTAPSSRDLYHLQFSL